MGIFRTKTFQSAYRTALTAADVVAVPGTVTCTKQAGGGLTANTYYVKVIAGNAMGRTTPKAGNATVTTETTNLTMRAAFAQVVGATFYDIYCSTASNPLWVGRITEAQRASGIKLTAVATTGAGGTAGAVDIEAVGTGNAADTSGAESTAYVLPSATIDCLYYKYADFEVLMSTTGDAAALAATFMPFFYDDIQKQWYAGTAVVVTLGGVTTALGPLAQKFRVEVDGCRKMCLVLEKLTGTGASLGIRAVLVDA